MRNRKRRMILLSVLLCLIMFAACSAPSRPDNTGNTADTNNTGNAEPAPAVPRDMTISDVKALAEKDAVTWQDLDAFNYEAPYSGRYVRFSYIDDKYEFSAEGSPADKPEYVMLCLKDYRYVSIWINKDANIDAFVKQCEELLVMEEPARSTALMRIKFPQYFDLDTSAGLTVIVSSLAEGKYACYFREGNVDWISSDYSERGSSAGPEEVKVILGSYSDVPAEKIIIRPFYDSRSERKMTHEEFEKELKAFFDNKFQFGPEVKEKGI